MLQKDKIKSIVAVCLFAAIIISLLIFGKEALITKYVVGICFAAWIAIMVIVNKKY